MNLIKKFIKYLTLGFKTISTNHVLFSTLLTISFVYYGLKRRGVIDVTSNKC